MVGGFGVISSKEFVLVVLADLVVFLAHCTLQHGAVHTSAHYMVQCTLVHTNGAVHYMVYSAHQCTLYDSRH